MLKKTLALILVLGMLSGTMTGCITGSNSDSDKDLEKTTTGTQVQEENFNKVGYPIVNEPITVTSMYAPSSTEGNPEEMSYWKKLEEVTNIKIKWNMLPNTEANTLNLFFAAGDFPDFFHTYVDAGRQFTYGVEGGMFVDYSEMMYEYMPNMVSWFNDFPEAEKAITQMNGAVYTLPRIQKASTGAAGQMFFRTDYLENVGLQTPTTVDEFYTALVKIKQADLTKGFSPLLPYSVAHLDSQMEPFLFAAFGDSTEADFADLGEGTVVYNRTSEQYKRYLEFMNKLYKEGLLENELFTIDTATTMARVKSGQSAFMSYAANLLEDDFADGKIHLDCLAPLTSEYTNTKKVKAYPYVSSGGGAINSKSKYAKELLRMFDINYSKDEVVPGSGLNCLSQNLGLYEVDWEYSNPEKSAYRLIVPEDWKESVWTYKSRYGSWAQFYSAFVFLGTSGTGNNLAREEGMLKNNIPYAVPQFPDTLMKYTVEEQNSIANNLTDIKSYVLQARAQFITGVEPLSNWDSYVKQIEEMGIKEVLKVKQAAYDRWNGE